MLLLIRQGSRHTCIRGQSITVSGCSAGCRLRRRAQAAQNAAGRRLLEPDGAQAPATWRFAADVADPAAMLRLADQVGRWWQVLRRDFSVCYRPRCHAAPGGPGGALVAGFASGLLRVLQRPQTFARDP